MAHRLHLRGLSLGRPSTASARAARKLSSTLDGPTRPRTPILTASPHLRPLTSSAILRSTASTATSRSQIPVLTTVSAVRAHRAALPPGSVALVPTMGALHAGHLSLVRAAARENAHVLVSVFLNPAQFGPAEDLASYPAQLARDLDLLAGVDAELATAAASASSSSTASSGGGRIAAVFAPRSVAEVYPEGGPSSEPDGDGSFVTITPLARRLEGASRPVFFRGVATVVMKLLNIARPDAVYFGQKDAQQLALVRRMVRDFFVPVRVVAVPTVREEDGLAMSSRNVYLGERRRAAGLVLSRALRTAEEAFLRGELDGAEILAAARKVLSEEVGRQRGFRRTERALFEPDYVSLAEPENIEEVQGKLDPRKGAVLSGAVKMLPLEETVEGERLGIGGDKFPVRLIDNIVFEPRE